MNPSRIKKIKKAIKIFGKEEVIRLLTEEVIKSNWLTGRVTAKNGSRYKLTLDSILKEEMLVKLKEGDFDNSNDTSNKYSNSYNDYNFYDDNSEPYDNNDEDGFRIGW